MHPGSGNGSANFGFNYIINSECCGTNYLTGSRVSIDAPGYNFEPTAATGDIARVVVENDDPSSGSAMLVQIGMAQTNGFGYEQCGGRTTLTNFWEYKPYSTSTTNYTCAWLSSIGTQATHYKYSAKSVPGAGSVWDIFLDGVLQKEVDLGIGVATIVYAGGELSSCSTCTRPLSGMIEACYACAVGDTQWQRFTINGATTTIGGAHTRNDTGYWTISNPISPFRLHHD